MKYNKIKRAVIIIFMLSTFVILAQATWDIKFPYSSIDCNVNEVKEIEGKVFPPTAKNKAIEFVSANSNLLVYGNEIIALHEGSYIIQACQDDVFYSSLQVNAYVVEAEQILFEEDSLSVNRDEGQEVSVKFYPENTSYKDVQYSVENENIAKVTGNIITGLCKGSTILNAVDTISGLKDSVKIDVKVPVKNVEISFSRNYMYVGDSRRLVAKILPNDADDKNISWSTSNSNIAYIENGVLYAKDEGTVNIQAAATDNVVDNYTLYVRTHTKSMRVSVSARCSNYNHVGNEWGNYFSVNGTTISSGSILTISDNTYTRIYTEIVEYDSIMDVGSNSYSLLASSDYLNNGFSVSQTIYVRENRGRYAGNIAVWQVEYSFSPI